MCGIAGIFNYGAARERVDAAELTAIRDRMETRGPDGCGLWISPEGNIGLAHRRLALVDLTPTGAQPMHSLDGSLSIVFNGEIYNYRELRSGLVRRGCRFQSTSDTEVLLCLYAEEGEHMVERLRGMFAFAIWDHARSSLFLARDAFGIKPLYYADNGRTFRFASQVKALLCGSGIDTTPDPAGHAGFFLWGSVPDRYTLYRGIRNLPAGATMWVRNGRAEAPRTYLRVADILAGAEAAAADLTLSADDCREQLRAAVEDSVASHLIADARVGIFLSAGCDSTTITAAACARGRTSDLQTVTLGFREYRGTQGDEVPLAEVVARHCGTEHRTHWLAARDFENDLDHVLDSMDQPSIDGVNTYFVSKAAASAGLKAALSGVGGDELFGGYPSFRQVPRAAHLAGWVPAALGAGLRRASAPLVKHLASPKYAGFFEYCGTYGGAYLLRRSLFMPWELPSLMDPDMARAGWQELDPVNELDQTVAGLRHPRLRVSALELTAYMRQTLLRDADWAGMAHSVEIRVPFVDVEFLRRVAPLMASEHAPGKTDLALSPSRPLPDALLARRKTGFNIPVREWLLERMPVRSRGLRAWSVAIAGQFRMCIPRAAAQVLGA
jgi:asparagine synthase (glutamine-hydrolysing)